MPVKAQALRPHDRVPRADGHVRPRHVLHARPRRRRHAPGVGGRRAQRQLHPRLAPRPDEPALRRQALHARGAVRRPFPRRHRRHHARFRQGDDRRGLPPDDHVFPAGRPRRDADRADGVGVEGLPRPVHRHAPRSGHAGQGGRGRAVPAVAGASRRAVASTRPARRGSRSSVGSRRPPLSRPPNSATPGGPTQSGGSQ